MSTCGIAGLIRDTGDVPFTYKGRTHMIKAITGDYCQTCGEIELDGTGEDAERFSQESLVFIQKVNADLANAAFYRGDPEKLGLTQKEQVSFWGVGRTAFRTTKAAALHLR